MPLDTLDQLPADPREWDLGSTIPTRFRLPSPLPRVHIHEALVGRPLGNAAEQRRLSVLSRNADPHRYVEGDLCIRSLAWLNQVIAATLHGPCDARRRSDHGNS